MAYDFTIEEIKENIKALKAAYLKAIESGGVTSYTLKSGQGETTVQQASLATLRNELTFFTYLLNERSEYENGTGCTFIRSAGI